MAACLLMSMSIMLILMSSVTLIVVILARQKPSSLNKSLRNLSIFILGHLMFSLFVSYCLKNSAGLMMIKCLSVVSDVLYFAVVAAWINIIAAFVEILVHRPVLKERVVYIVVAVYGVICESIVILSGNYLAGADEAFVANEAIRHALVLLNALFAVAVMAVSIAFLVLGISAKMRHAYCYGAVFFSVLLILYMAWILIFDYSAVSGVQNTFVDRLSFDPLFVICSLVDVAVLFFFFKKDPLEIFSIHSVKQKAELLDEFAEKYKLTVREREVLEQACMGRNNPAIAESLFISEYTVKRHMNNIFKKTEVKNRYELISKVMEK